MSSFDLNTLDTKTVSEAGIVVELEHPSPMLTLCDDEKRPYWIKIMGGDAGKVRDKEREQLDRYIEAIRKNRSPGDSGVGEQDVTDKLAASTLDWYLPDLDGAPMPSASYQAALKLYSDPRFPWIIEQVIKAQKDRARFFKKSSSI